MSSPDWSDEHVTRANRVLVHVVVAWLGLVTLSAALSGTGTFGFVFVGLVVLGATWLLVHSLFTQVDGLVRTRLAEAGAVEKAETATDTAGDGAGGAESD